MLKIEISIHSASESIDYVSCKLIADNKTYNCAIEYNEIDINKMLQAIEIALNEMLWCHEKNLLNKKEQ